MKTVRFIYLAAVVMLFASATVQAQNDDLYFDPSNSTQDGIPSSSYQEEASQASPSSTETYYSDSNDYHGGEYYDEADDNEYQYSSRIRRFHRNYQGFDYYDPCYVETCYYDPFFYEPGISIYLGNGDYGSYRQWRRYQRFQQWNYWNQMNQWQAMNSWNSYNQWYGYNQWSAWNQPYYNNWAYNPYGNPWCGGYNPYGYNPYGYGNGFNGWGNSPYYDPWYSNSNGGQPAGTVTGTYVGSRRGGTIKTAPDEGGLVSPNGGRTAIDNTSSATPRVGTSPTTDKPREVETGVRDREVTRPSTSPRTETTRPNPSATTPRTETRPKTETQPAHKEPEYRDLTPPARPNVPTTRPSNPTPRNDRPSNPTPRNDRPSSSGGGSVRPAPAPSNPAPRSSGGGNGGGSSSGSKSEKSGGGGRRGGGGK